MPKAWEGEGLPRGSCVTTPSPSHRFAMGPALSRKGRGDSIAAGSFAPYVPAMGQPATVPSPADAAALERIKDAVGPKGWIADPGAVEPYLVEERGLFHGATLLVVRPASTEEVARVVRLCAEARLPIVP